MAKVSAHAQADSTPTLPTSQRTSLGIDVAKDQLQLHFPQLPKLTVLPNTAAGVKKLTSDLLAWQRTTARVVHVCLEATGGYERLVFEALSAAGLACSVLNPRRVRAFAVAEGQLAKTDPLDAKVLWHFGDCLRPEPTVPPSAPQRELSELMARRNQLIDLRSAEKNRAAMHRLSLLQKGARGLIAALDRQIEQIDRAVAKLAAQDALLEAKIARLCQAKGIGRLTAVSLLACMPELGTLNRNEATHLAGLAPFARDSGKKQGLRTIGGGRAGVRRALYMAALTASRSNPVLKDIYERLRQRGKAAKLALTAVMRRLLILLNSLLKDPHFQLREASCTRLKAA